VRWSLTSRACPQSCLRGPDFPDDLPIYSNRSHGLLNPSVNGLGHGRIVNQESLAVIIHRVNVLGLLVAVGR
jgi:hypothetical protein